MKQLLFFAALLAAACGSTPSDRSGATEQPQTPVAYTERIDLLLPDSTGGLTIDEALWRRASYREFSSEALSLEELSGVLWAAGGINRPENNHLTAPSALALYPVRIYAFLPEGVYAYDPAARTLTRVAEGDQRQLAGTQPFVATAPLNLVYVADLSVYDALSLPAEQVRYLCGQDAAGYAENANLYAAGHGLKAITRGSAPQKELLALLGLDPARYCFVLAQTVGK